MTDVSSRPEDCCVIACDQCARCDEFTYDRYMVKDEIWTAARCSPRWVLHFECLEAWLNRPLTIEDFTNAPINRGIRLGFRIGQQSKIQEKQG